jgi:hypothetical protein
MLRDTGSLDNLESESSSMLGRVWIETLVLASQLANDGHRTWVCRCRLAVRTAPDMVPT